MGKNYIQDDIEAESKKPLDERLRGNYGDIETQKKGKLRTGVVAGSIFALAVSGAAVAEYYTGFIGNTLDGGKSLVHRTSERATDAYQGTLNLIADLRSPEVKISAARELLQNAPLDVRTMAAAEMYLSLPESHQGPFLRDALNGTFGPMGDGLREAIADDLLFGASGGELISLVQKGYLKMDEESRIQVLDGVLDGLTGEGRYEHAWNSYQGLEKSQQLGFAAQMFLDRPKGEQHEMMGKALSALPPEQRYLILDEELNGMPAPKVRELMTGYAVRAFTRDDFVETIGALYALSRYTHNNGSQIIKEIVTLHASEISDRIQKYTKELMD